MNMPDQRIETGDHASIGDERFLRLLDTLPYLAFVIPAGGYPAHYNSQFVAYLGFRPGPGTADRTALHHPDDQAALTAAREAGVAAESDYVVEIRLRRHDGAYRWHRVHNKPLFEDGRRIAYLGTAVDIHDARTANALLEERVRERTAALEAANRRLSAEEARYRDLYNRTPMALHSADAQARLLDVNDTWLEMFGYGRDAVIGRSPASFMTDASALTYREHAWPEMLASRGQVRVVDYQFVTAGGRVFDGRLAARGVFDAAGCLVRTWSVIADVTMEKQADRALRQAQRLDAIGQLTAGIAHDFNNLLTAILGNLELAARPGQQDESRRLRLIAGARAAAERGARLTGQLLAFSRQQRIAAEPVDVNAVLEGMRPLLAGVIGGAIDVVITAEPGLPRALADVTQLELAILNLAINARDALGAINARDALGAGGRITITATVAATAPPVRPEEPERGDYVAVEVRDDGPGIPDAVRDRMFEPFFTTKGAGRGSGLGLAQVLGIAKQLGGGIKVRSAPGEGTAVCLLLPLATGADGVGVAALDDRGPGPPGRLSRILLVDDDPDVRATAGLMLREAGHTVLAMDSGPAALDALARARGAFDLLLADVVMPGMNGTELAALVHDAWPGLPVLFMTGYADAGLLPAERWGEVLPKPFSAAELEARVARAAWAATGPAA